MVVLAGLAAVAAVGPLATPSDAQTPTPTPSPTTSPTTSAAADAEGLPTAEQRRADVSARLAQIQVSLAETEGRALRGQDELTAIDEERLPANAAAQAKAIADRVAPERARRELVLDTFINGDPRSTHLLDTLRDGVLSLDAFVQDVLGRAAEDWARGRLAELDELSARLGDEAVALRAERDDTAAAAGSAVAAADALRIEQATLTEELASVDRQIERLKANTTGAPLTGLANLVSRPALAVKIDNLSPARPQSGLNQADLVYEELVEGGITRYIAVFQSTDAAAVGPIRSGRTSDLLILANLNRALYGASGGNSYVLDALRGANLVSILEDAPGVFYRLGTRGAPHNLYSSTKALYDANPGGTSEPPRLFSYLAPGEVVANGRPTTGVEVEVGNDSVTYTWNGKGWQRSVGGRPEVDADGVAIAPENVILQFTDYGSSAADSNSPEAQPTGQGEAWVLTAGQVVQGTWSRPFPEEVTHYAGPDGLEIRLTPGRTWIPLPRPGSASLLG